MKEMFGQPRVVDEVRQYELSDVQEAQHPEWFVIRTNTDIEDMTVGDPANRFAFKKGTRYCVPEQVAQILFNRDYLMEVPYPWEPIPARR